jgi:glycine/D-amino acid oxidase-like deaminating enzyme
MQWMTLIYLFRHRPTGYAYAGKRKSQGSLDWPRRGTGFLPDGYRGSGSVWAKVIAKYSDPAEYEYIVLGRPSSDDWERYERRAIALTRALFGRKCLNRTEGGDGFSSETRKRLHQDPAWRRKQRRALRRALDTPEFKEKVRQATAARWQDPEMARRMLGKTFQKYWE